VSNEQQTQQADDPSGPGWRDVLPYEILQTGDMYPICDQWEPTQYAGQTAPSPRTYRRRIEPPQPSDSEAETVKDLRQRLDEYAVLLDEADRGGRQVNAELQQLREQVTTLTRERDRLQLSLRDHYRDGQQAAAEALQTWLRPVLELVAEYPDDASPLAVAVLGFLPGIASRLIEE